MTADNSLPSKQQLLAYFQELKSAGRSYRKVLARVAYYGWRLKECEGWTELGYESEDEIREAADIPVATWYKYVRLGGILRQLSLEELESIPTRNLELLTQVTPDQWAEHNWLEEAKSLDAEGLAKAITDSNYSKGISREPMDTVRWRVPYSAKSVIEKAVETFQEEHDISTPGRALELLVADKCDRVSLSGALVKINKALADLKILLNEQGIINPTVHDHVDAIKAYINEVCAKAIQNSREAAHRKNGRSRENGSPAIAGGSGGVEETEVESMAYAGRDLPIV